jgi:hypothetical protein
MNASALSATSRHPLSIVRAYSRLGISTISVTEGARDVTATVALGEGGDVDPPENLGARGAVANEPQQGRLRARQQVGEHRMGGVGEA